MRGDKVGWQTMKQPPINHLMMLVWWKLIIMPISLSTAAAEVPVCSMTLTATVMPFHLCAFVRLTANTAAIRVSSYSVAQVPETLCTYTSCILLPAWFGHVQNNRPKNHTMSCCLAPLFSNLSCPHLPLKTLPNEPAPIKLPSSTLLSSTVPSSGEVRLSICSQSALVASGLPRHGPPDLQHIRTRFHTCRTHSHTP